jgi:threonine/homoserine/homoserine lactone efflux protein
MFEYLFIGCGFALAAAVQPGPLQAFLLSSVAQKGWKRTLPASLSPLLSDGPIALLVLLALSHMSDTICRILQAAGGFLLLYFAWSSYQRWKRNVSTNPDEDDSNSRTLVQAAMVNILNPNPYIGWAFVLGPALLGAWSQNRAYAIVFIVSFYGTMVLVLAGIIFLMGTTQFLGSRGRRILLLVSAATLGVLGVFQLVASLVRARAV